MRVERGRVILTPEHVEIRLVPAGPGSRFVALVVDSGIVMALSSVLYLLLTPTLPAGLGFLLWTTVAFVLQWGWHVYFETRARGQSPGKRLLGLRVIDGRGLPLTVAQSFVRNVVRAVDLLPAFYGVGALTMAVDPYRRRLGDLAADTLVIREGRAVGVEDRLLQAPQFNSLKEPALLRRIRQRVGVDEREFLPALCLRLPVLEPRARFELVEEVAAGYRKRLGIEDLPIANEALLRGLAAIVAGDLAARR